MFQYREVIIAAHNDPNDAGLNFAKKITESIPTAKIVLMPKGHDMNSYYLESGLDELCRVLGV
jgi:hypothetical protein